MQTIPSRLLPRAALVAVALFAAGATAGTAAAQMPFNGYFYCHHEDTLGNFVDIPGDNPDAGAVPTTLDLVVAGAGCSSFLQSPVLCFSDDYRFDLVSGTGTARFKLRDRTGDMLVLLLNLTLGAPNLADPWRHPFATFETTFVVDGAQSTGRFAGASGSGWGTGWADNDPGIVFVRGQGYWELCGTLQLAGHTWRPRLPWRCPPWK